MKMPRHEQGIDICSIQLAPHESGRRALPDRVLNIYDRGHQRDEAKIPLNHRQKRADPSAITGAKHAEPLATAIAQHCHQLPRLDYSLTQTLGVANKVGSYREFTIPIAARDT